MTVLLEIYGAGLAATAVTSIVAERACPPHQRTPLGRHLVLALVWPLYLAFLGAVLIASTDRG